MGVILTGETLGTTHTTPNQDAAAAAYVRRVADRDGFDARLVLAMLGLGGAR